MAEPTVSNYVGGAALDNDTSLGGDQVNIKTFTLGSSINSSQTSIPASATITGVTVRFYLLADSELIYVESISGSDFNVVVRGAGGTTAASHSSGIPLYVVYAAGLFNQLKRSIIAIETELGINPSGGSGDVVSRLNAMDTTIAGTEINPNILINGDIEVWQRGTSYVAAANNTRVADMFKYQKTGAMVHDITQSTDVPTISQSGNKSRFSLKLDVTTVDASIAAGDFAGIHTAIEGYDYAHIKDQTVTLSFWVKGTKTGVHCVSFRNNGDDRSYVVEYTINTTNTWEKKTITLTLNQSGGTESFVNTLGLSIFWTLAAGSTFQTTAGSWQTGNFLATSNQVNATDNTANDFFLSQVKLERASTATLFRKRPYTNEKELCRHFFFKTFDDDVAPAQNAGTDQGVRWPAPVAGAAAHRPAAFIFPVSMRIAPAVTFYNPSAANAQARDVTAAADLTATAVGAVSQVLIDINATGAAGTAVGNSIIVCFAAEAGF